MLMFSVIARKSRAFPSISCSANERVCRSCEGAQTDRQPSWAMETLRTMDVMLSL